MYIKRHLSFVVLYFYTWRMVLISLFTGSLAYFTYSYLDWKWVAIPWLPVSLIGTATAFYVGFKNNQSYDRTWEARKIWGGITNLSRSFAAGARAYINSDSANSTLQQEAIDDEIRILLYRHLAWLHALKNAMHQRTSWEHHDKASIRQRNALHKNYPTFEEEITPYLTAEELQWAMGKKNMATQLLDRQSQHLAALKRQNLIDDFRHVELQKLITEMYCEQGRSERIKNTPFPRQYATSGLIFIFFFTLLLPFGLLGEFAKLGDGMLWLLIPFNLVVTWVFLLMEYTGDVSENPFEGLLNDVPLRTIIRNIEIDLKDMLEEDNLPPRIQGKFGSLF